MLLCGLSATNDSSKNSTAFLKGKTLVSTAVFSSRKSSVLKPSRMVPGGTWRMVPGGTWRMVPGGTWRMVPGGTWQMVPGGTWRIVCGGTWRIVCGGTWRMMCGGTWHGGKGSSGYFVVIVFFFSSDESLSKKIRSSQNVFSIKPISIRHWFQFILVGLVSPFSLSLTNVSNNFASIGEFGFLFLIWICRWSFFPAHTLWSSVLCCKRLGLVWEEYSIVITIMRLLQFFWACFTLI